MTRAAKATWQNELIRAILMEAMYQLEVYGISKRLHNRRGFVVELAKMDMFNPVFCKFLH